MKHTLHYKSNQIKLNYRSNYIIKDFLFTEKEVRKSIRIMRELIVVAYQTICFKFHQGHYFQALGNSAKNPVPFNINDDSDAFNVEDDELLAKMPNCMRTA